MCVEEDWASVPLAQADRGRHAEEMIAVNEIDPRSGKRLRDLSKPRGLKPRSGIIAMQPLLAGTQKSAVQNFSQRHAGKKAGIGIKVARRGDIGFGSW